jgi:DNA repair exonuclease SbcCD ATPase subunit
MLNLKSISIRNFLSFGNIPTVIDLSKDQSLMIVGDNKDVGDQGISRNGVGKTTSIQAIVFALYGKGIDKLKSDEFINIVNQKELVVELEFEIKGQYYKIRRGRKPNVVELENLTSGVSMTRDSMKNTDDAIAQIVGMPYEIFVGVFFMSPHKESFMAMGTAEQRSFIENILSLNVLAERAETLKAMKKDVVADLKIEQEKLQLANTQNEKIEQQIISLENSARQFEQNRSDKTRMIEQELSNYAGVDYEKIIDSIEKIEMYYRELDGINKKIHASDKISSELSRKHSVFVTQESKLSQIVESHKIYSLDKEQSEYDTLVTELSGELTEDEILNAIKENSEASERVQKLREELRAIEHDIQRKENKRTTLEQQKESILAELSVLESGVCPYCSQKHVDHEKVELIKQQVRNIDAEISELSAIISNNDSKSNEINRTLAVISADIIDVSELKQLQFEIRENNKKLKQLKEKIDTGNPFDSKLASVLGEMGYSSVEEAISGLKSQESELISEIGAEKSKNMQLVIEYEEKKQQISELEKQIVPYKTTSDVDRVLDKIESLELQLKENMEKNNHFVDQIESTKTLIVDASETQETVDELTKKETHIGYLVKLLTDPKSFVRKNIVDQYIPLLNKNINTYARELGLNHVSTINADLSVDIAYMQRPVSYYNMSQGERMRLNLATTAAFRDLMVLLG